MKPLYEISNHYKQILSEIEESNEITPEQLESLRVAESDLKIKAQNYSHIIKQWESEVEILMQHETNLEKRRVSLTKKIASLREHLKNELESCGINEIKTDLFRVKLCKNPCKVNILDKSKVEEIYMRKTVSESINIEMIKEHLKKGIELDYAKLESSTRLEIK